MSRKLLSMQAPPWKDPEDIKKIQLTLETITPMFGGSATARECSGQEPIRASSLRGILRFWWRATAGASYHTSESLYQAEQKLWGSIDTPGNVCIRVETLKPGSEWWSSSIPRADANSGPQESYFLFPFQANKKEGTTEATGRKGVKFCVILSIKNEAIEKIDEIKQSVSAWLTFGGVGSRTRRGCGALKCENGEWLPKLPEDKEYFQGLLCRNESTTSIPTLHGGWTMFAESASPEQCWKVLGRFWAQFHKGYTNNRQQYVSSGLWSDHSNLKSLKGKEIALSKPYLGLPIIYQSFKGSFAGTINSEKTGRMASPIILKPVAFADGSIRPMIACLNAPSPEKIRINNDEAISLNFPKDEPVLQNFKADDPLDAVRKAAKLSGFREVLL